MLAPPGGAGLSPAPLPPALRSWVIMTVVAAGLPVVALQTSSSESLPLFRDFGRLG